MPPVLGGWISECLQRSSAPSTAHRRTVVTDVSETVGHVCVACPAAESSLPALVHVIGSSTLLTI